MKMKITRQVDRILNLIEKENITKITDFAKKLNITPAGAFGHISRMKKSGAIKDSYKIDYTKFGLISVLFLLEMFQPVDAFFIDEVKKIKNVKKIERVNGDFDYMIFSVFPSEEDMRHFMTTLLFYNDKIRRHSIIILQDGHYE